MRTHVRIGDRILAPDRPVFCIAEIGVNHNGDMKLAKTLIDEANSAGADAVKFQTYRARDLVGRDTPLAEYQIKGSLPWKSQYEMLHALELSEKQHIELAEYAQQENILFLSTPHSGERSVELILKIGVQALKIGSGDLTNIPFLRFVARKGKPVILSTGMATLAEVESAVAALREDGCADPVVLHCTTEYPCVPAAVNLRAMQTMSEQFDVAIGYSDHTIGLEAAVLATRLGAVCIEKHITLDRKLPGPDHQASMEPHQFRSYIAAVRSEREGGGEKYIIDQAVVELMLGKSEKVPTEAEERTARLVRKSIVTSRKIPRGTTVRESDLTMRRPGTGISPPEMSRIIGMRTRRELPVDTLLDWQDLE